MNHKAAVNYSAEWRGSLASTKQLSRVNVSMITNCITCPECESFATMVAILQILSQIKPKLHE